VSGLAAALTAVTDTGPDGPTTVLLEASDAVGGRVRSDKTDSGYILDRGFAVFIEEYPAAKELLDYRQLNLGKFQPGSLVYTGERTKGSTGDDDKGDLLHKVADPLRRPQDLFVALTAPVGTLSDKIRVISLLLHVFTSTVEELFEEPETDTLSCLKDRWGFTDKFVDEFYRPFLEGIYLAPLQEQSSRMFHFVFKMFAEGAATLPSGGIGAVTTQLAERAASPSAQQNPTEIRTDTAVAGLKMTVSDNEESCIEISLREDPQKIIRAKSAVVAADGNMAHRLLSSLDNFGGEDLEPQPQRRVGVLYYGFQTVVPVDDPILILNGKKGDSGPVNNICFPSVVNPTYAPSGSNLASVTILGDALEEYADRPSDLDAAVRSQLSAWFPARADEIKGEWELLGSYDVPNAQPSQLGGPSPASVHGGGSPGMYRKKPLPAGMFVCGDHVATATLNGALESGMAAGEAAAKYVLG